MNDLTGTLCQYLLIYCFVHAHNTFYIYVDASEWTAKEISLSEIPVLHSNTIKIQDAVLYPL